MNELERQIESLLVSQKQEWKLAHDNYASLAHVQTRCLEGEDGPVFLQFNPGRIRSSCARIDKASLEARPCFFCHRPKEQRSVVYNDSFELMVNPYPIFKDHLTIPLRWHERQQIKPYFRDMLDIAFALPEYALFYNGPKCGASAPDHMHFQAGRKEDFPVIRNWGKIPKQVVRQDGQACLFVSIHTSPVMFVWASESLDGAVDIFEMLYAKMEIRPGDDEPMMNLLTWTEGKRRFTCLFPRRELRPSCYYAEGDANILISPATVEMSGLFVVPLEKDFKKITYSDLKTVWKEVSITEEEKERLVGEIKEE